MENIGGSLSLICKTSMYYASLCSFLPFSILIFDCLSAKSVSLDFIFVSATWLVYFFLVFSAYISSDGHCSSSSSSKCISNSFQCSCSLGFSTDVSPSCCNLTHRSNCVVQSCCLDCCGQTGIQPQFHCKHDPYHHLLCLAFSCF